MPWRDLIEVNYWRIDGALPTDLPLELPTRFYVTVNLRTARARRGERQGFAWLRNSSALS
jgi:hypothetical protein